MSIRMSKVRVLPAIALISLVFLFLLTGAFAVRWAVGAMPLPFASEQQVDIAVLSSHYFVNDLVGIDGRNADLPAAYVISHSARPAALVELQGGSALQWSDRAGISQDPLLPGWGGTRQLSERSGALQLDYLQTMIVGRFTVDPTAAVEIDIDLPWHARVADRGEISLRVIERGSDYTRVSLRLEGEGMFQIEALPPPSDGFPVRFNVRNLLPSQIVVGGEQVSPPASSFSLQTRDLHSFALGEIDGDADVEFSVVRGGLRGLLADRGWPAQDLLYDVGERREIGVEYPGFDKRGCPGRQSAWVDIDRDGHLELYVVCGRAEGDSASFANQLFRFADDGVRDIAAEVGLDLAGSGSFRFVDWDGDGWDDLLWVDAAGDVVFYRNSNGVFVENQRLQGHRYKSHQVPQLLLCDINDDRRPDIFIVHHQGNQLVVNDGGKIRLDDQLLRRGLPLKALAGSWIDFDLDGIVDFFTVDHGLYRGVGSGRFDPPKATSSNLLRKFFPAARIANVDVGGHRKLLVAINRCLPGRICNWQRQWLVSARRFASFAFLQQSLGFLETDDWDVRLLGRVVLDKDRREVALFIAGPKWNPRSIGAHVDLAEGPRHWVGEAETSHFSQGNFAVYLVAKRHDSVSAKVTWGDGCKAEVEIPAQVAAWTIDYPQQCLAN